MTKIQFIRKLKDLGFTDHFIGKVLALRQKELEQGVKRRYEDYLPDNEVKK